MVNLRQQQKEHSRRQLLSTAGQQFRKKGYAATGLSQVTQDAGLTNGAFYAHFSSKEHLLQDALTTACEQLREYWHTDNGENQRNERDWIEQLLLDYLSEDHLAMAEQGCIVPTLAAEVARSEQATRQVFQTEVGKNIAPLNEKLATLSGNNEHSPWGLLALLAGGVMLARAVADPEMASEILTSSQKVGAEYLNAIANNIPQR